MQPAASRDLFAALEQVPDPRGRQGQRHPLTAMLAGIVCATLCGARGFRPIAQWLRVAQSLALDVRGRFAWDIPPELTDVFTKFDPLFYNLQEM